MTERDDVSIEVAVGSDYEPPERVRAALAEVAGALAAEELLDQDEVAGFGFDATQLSQPGQPQYGSLGVFRTPTLSTSFTGEDMFCVSRCAGGYSGGSCGASYCAVDW